MPGAVEGIDRVEGQSRSPGHPDRQIDQVPPDQGMIFKVSSKGPTPANPLLHFQMRLFGHAHGADGIGQTGQGEVFQGVINAFLRPSHQVGFAVLQFHLP